MIQIKRVRESAPFKGKRLGRVINPKMLKTMFYPTGDRNNLREVFSRGYGTFTSGNYSDGDIADILIPRFDKDQNNPSLNTDFIDKLKNISNQNDMNSSDWKGLLSAFQSGAYPFEKVPLEMRVVPPQNLDYIVDQLLNNTDSIKMFLQNKRNPPVKTQVQQTQAVQTQIVPTRNGGYDGSGINPKSDPIAPLPLVDKSSATMGYVFIGALVLGGYLISRKKNNGKRR